VDFSRQMGANEARTLQVQEVSKEMGVQYVLEGSVRKAGLK
jgi:TolB-like protein